MAKRRREGKEIHFSYLSLCKSWTLCSQQPRQERCPLCVSLWLFVYDSWVIFTQQAGAGRACLDLAQLPDVALRAHTPGDQAVSMEVTPKGLQGLRKGHVQGLTQQYTHSDMVTCLLYMEATPNGPNTICYSVLGFLPYKMGSLNSAHLSETLMFLQPDRTTQGLLEK